jgi:hypothetical protein
VTIPSAPLPVPAVVRRIAEGRSVRPVWASVEPDPVRIDYYRRLRRAEDDN